MVRTRSSTWAPTAVMFLCAALNYADRTVTASVLPLFRKEFGMSDVALGAIASLFLWSYAAGSPFAGYIADRLPRRWVVVGSLVGWSGVTGVTALVSGTQQFLATRILLGLAECFYLPAAVALIADYSTKTNRATAMGIHVAGLGFGMVVGGALGGYIGEHYGWRILFAGLGAGGLALAALASIVLPPACDTGEPAQARILPLASVRLLAGVRTYRVVLAEGMLVAVGIWLFVNWLPLYFSETFHLSLAQAGFHGTFEIQIGTTLGFAIGGLRSDTGAIAGRERRMRLMTVFYLLAAPFPVVFLMAPGMASVIACVFLFSLFRTMGSANEHPILCDVLEPRLRSTGIGIINLANCLAGGLATFAAGYLKAQFGLGVVFSFVSTLLLSSALLAMWGYRKFIHRDLELGAVQIASGN